MKHSLRDDELSPNRILQSIVENDNIEYTYIIFGRSGRTGKTWLYRELIRFGFNAFEITEDIYHLIDYKNYENHFIVNEVSKQVIIVLNKLY